MPMQFSLVLFRCLNMSFQSTIGLFHCQLEQERVVFF